jgi:hypothetical protein
MKHSLSDLKVVMTCWHFHYWCQLLVLMLILSSIIREGEVKIGLFGQLGIFYACVPQVNQLYSMHSTLLVLSFLCLCSEFLRRSN